MKKWILLSVISLFILALGGGVVKADELEELKKEVIQLQNRIEQLEAKQKQQDKQMEEKISEVVEKKQIEALPDSVKWIENVKISGDFRYRHETIEEEADNKDDRHRDRIRARLGIEAKVNDEVDVGLRIASGSADPASTNQSLEDSFSSKTLWLDLAYFDWHPQAISNFNLYGGKMKNPFYAVGNNQLIWDGDLNPEGMVAKYVMTLNEHNKLHINGGGFWVDESSSGVDTSLFGAQAYLKHIFKDESYLLAGASYFDYGNIKDRSDLQSTWSSSSNFFGNPTHTKSGSTVFLSDYDLIEAFGEYGTKLGGMPVSLFGNWVQNTSADTSEDAGWLIGCTINKAKNPGSWQFSYNYRELQSEAVLGSFCDSDFIGGGTDGRGHQFGVTYQLAKNWQAGLTYYLAEETRTTNRDDKYRRLQADLVFKF